MGGGGQDGEIVETGLPCLSTHLSVSQVIYISLNIRFIFKYFHHDIYDNILYRMSHET